jgi:hypothetical protein
MCVRKNLKHLIFKMEGIVYFAFLVQNWAQWAHIQGLACMHWKGGSKRFCGA